MGHYALVKDGIVVQVFVLDDDKVEESERFTGNKFIKTSYNTKDGVHYGADQKPDGGEALRLNYAQVGGGYDEVRDVFFDKPLAEPTTYNYWDSYLLRYLPVMPENMNGKLYTGGYPKSGREVYLSEEGMAQLGRYSRAGLMGSAGISFTQDIAQAHSFLAYSAEQMKDICAVAQDPPMSEQTLAVILDPAQWDQLQYIKHTEAPAAAHMRLCLRVAVNEHGEIYVFDNAQEQWDGECIASEPTRVPDGELLEWLQVQIEEVGIRRSVHTLRFIFDEGEHKLVQWLPYLEEPFAQVYPGVYPVLTDALLHTLGEGLLHQCDEVFRQMKRVVTGDGQLAERICKLGLFVIHTPTHLDVYGIGQEADVQTKFARMGELLQE